VEKARGGQLERGEEPTTDEGDLLTYPKKKGIGGGASHNTGSHLSGKTMSHRGKRIPWAGKVRLHGGGRRELTLI